MLRELNGAWVLPMVAGLDELIDAGISIEDTDPPNGCGVEKKVVEPEFVDIMLGSISAENSSVRLTITD